MPLFVDTPRWLRHHGLSGHLIADTEEELDDFGASFGLPQKDRSSGSPIPHYLLASSRRDAVIAAGAIPLDPAAWARKLADISSGMERGLRKLRQASQSSKNVKGKLRIQPDLFNDQQRMAG